MKLFSPKDILFGLALLIALPSFAAPKDVNIATEQWENYTNADGTGYYIDILKATFETQGIKLNINYVPYLRSVKMVDAQESDVVLGLYGDELKDGLYSEVVELDLVDGIMMPSLAATFKDINSLAGKKVIAQTGYAFNTSTDVIMDYSEVPTLESMLQMLVAGRVDAILDYATDVDTANKSLPHPVKYEVKYGIFKKPIVLGFANNEKGKALKEIFNAQLKKLVASGELKKIYAQTQKEGYPY